MMDTPYAVGVLVAMGVVTFALRAFPFLTAHWLQQHPAIGRIGEFLPLAIMVLLLLHSLAGAASAHAGGPWPELAAAGLAAGLQWFRRNALLSMLAGTGCYVALINPGLF